MASLESREQAIEAAFRHDQDMAFRIRTRRDRLLGFWIAELIGLKGGAADAYARDLFAASVEQRLVSAVTRTVRRDLEAHGIRLSDAAVSPKGAGQLRRGYWIASCVVSRAVGVRAMTAVAGAVRRTPEPSRLGLSRARRRE